jgi:hypothetical protein
VIQPIYAVEDGFTYPSVESSLKLTITNDAGMMSNVMAPADAMSDQMMMPAMTEMTPEASMMGEMTPEATDSMMMAQPTTDGSMMEMTPEATMGS